MSYVREAELSNFYHRQCYYRPNRHRYQEQYIYISIRHFSHRVGACFLTPAFTRNAQRTSGRMYMKKKEKRKKKALKMILRRNKLFARHIESGSLTTVKELSFPAFKCKVTLRGCGTPWYPRESIGR